ncbi:extracellular solute-binding protein [Paenibacillus sp. N1-5-1-14]|uniref:extracellular solute-binding protein n=1 Tax=Paenibacillus radicibacter TaxID=2972488 RepID=UPI002159A61D|nr:extracellular solute-binding protein [Paenibacillus radicibacter]MCR8641317.1 extracellular solute-binding protein [Paenibacillus radicibacter]
MRRTMKWKSMILPAMALTLITSACSSNTASSTNSPSTNTTSSTDGNSNAKPVKLSIFITSRATDAMYSNETMIWKELGKKLNIEFEFITGDAKTMNDKFPIMVASGEIPDIVSGRIRDFNKFGAQGAFQSLNELIKKAPNIQKYLMDDKAAKMQTMAADGNMYSIPMLSAVRTSEGPLVRKDWLDKLGLPMPETIDDWYTVLKAFKEKDANGNGDANDEVPFATTGTPDTYYLNFADAWGIDLNADGRWMEESGKMVFTPIDPRAKEYLATMNKWYSEGLLDKEMLSRQEKDYTAMIFNDKVGVTNHWVGYVAGFNARPEAQKIPGFNFQVAQPPVLKKGDKPLTSRQQQITVPWAWAIGNKNKNVEATMKLFDYVYSDEGQLLLNFGLEGDTYTKSGNDVKYTDKITKNADGSAKALYRIGAQSLIGFRQDARYEKASCVSDDACKQLFDYVDHNYFRDPVPSLKYTEDDAEKFNEISTPMNTYVDEMMSKFIIGQEPIGKFDDFVAKVKSMRFDEVNQIQQKAYAKYKEMSK